MICSHIEMLGYFGWLVFFHRPRFYLSYWMYLHFYTEIYHPRRMNCSNWIHFLSLSCFKKKKNTVSCIHRSLLSFSYSVHHSDFDSLNEEDVAANNQLAFDVAERQLGIQPVTTGKEMAAEAEPDKLLMVLYLSKFYEAFRNSPVNNNGENPSVLSSPAC